MVTCTTKNKNVSAFYFTRLIDCTCKLKSETFSKYFSDSDYRSTCNRGTQLEILSTTWRTNWDSCRGRTATGIRDDGSEKSTTSSCWSVKESASTGLGLGIQSAMTIEAREGRKQAERTTAPGIYPDCGRRRWRVVCVCDFSCTRRICLSFSLCLSCCGPCLSSW